MWEASLGIIAMLAVMFSIAILFSVSGKKPRTPSPREIARAIGAINEDGQAGEAGSTSLNTEPDSQRDAAYQQAAKGILFDRSSKTSRTPAEMAAGER